MSLSTPKLSKREACGVSFYTDDELFEECGVRIAFTCRRTGVSAGGFESLNLASHVGDDLSLVEENRRICLKALGSISTGARPSDVVFCGASSSTKLVTLDQVHGTEVLTIDAPALDRIDCGFSAPPLASADAVALTSTASDVAAMLMFADCVPVILVAPDGAFAVIHSGWKGTIARISAKVVSALCELGDDLSPNCLNAYIGPCIRSECFEVDLDLAKRFSREFGAQVVVGKRNVDLPLSVKLSLLQAGLIEERVCDLARCTVCNADEFFSYRATGGDCGRHAAIAMR